MLAFLITVAIGVWFALQFHGWRRQRWERRWNAWLRPLGMMIGTDARAVSRSIREEFAVRKMRRSMR